MSSQSRPTSDSKHPRRAQLPYRFRSAVYARNRSSSTNSEHFDDDSSGATDSSWATDPRNTDDENHGESASPESRHSAPTTREESLAGAQLAQLPLDAIRDDPVRIAGGAVVAVLLVALGGLLASVGVQWMMDEWTGSDGPFVVVPDAGTLRGSRGMTERGTQYSSFMGIPYAMPPLENARFRPPVPLPPSCGLRDARYEGTVCPQPPSSDYVSYSWRWPTVHQVLSWVMLLPRLLLLGVRGILQEEDCLTINVHTSSLGHSTNHSAAVLVWVHGGGFFIGDGNRDEYGPDFFIDEGLIFVSFNYRLGVLGFLSLCTERAPGNAGLKDQVAALKWVRKHIASFGGDPSRVTLWGESAGAVAVHLLTMSPNRHKLPVKNAIVSSGVALAGWALEREPRRRAAALATALGWKAPPGSENPKSCTGFPGSLPPGPHEPPENDALLQFLLRQPAHQLVRHMKDVVADDLTGAEHLAWVPCIEPPIAPDDIGEDTRILTADPAVILEAGALAKIPLIIGVNSHEGMVWLAGKSDAAIRRQLLRIQRQMVTLVIPDLPLLDRPPTSNQSLLAAERIRHFYFGRKAINLQTLPEFIDMYSDILFVVPFMETVALHIRATAAPVYLYRFSFEGRLNFCKRIIAVSLPGASHADELGYLFHIGILPKVEITPTCPEHILRSRIVRLWSNFVRTGNPTPYKDPLLDNVIWEPATPGNIVFLEIGEVLAMQKDMFGERRDFWRDLYHEIFLRRVHW